MSEDSFEKEFVKNMHVRASEGIADVQNGLGEWYANGINVPKDDAKAVAWFCKAAAQGFDQAQRNLGCMYSEGRGGLTQDYEEAVVWFVLAAEQGDAAAQTDLGRMYSEGLGVVQDDKEAVVWFRLAAEQGDAVAQTNLEQMYREGRGGSRR